MMMFFDWDREVRKSLGELMFFLILVYQSLILGALVLVEYPSLFYVVGISLIVITGIVLYLSEKARLIWSLIQVVCTSYLLYFSGIIYPILYVVVYLFLLLVYKKIID